jgi:hypothetical protein
MCAGFQNMTGMHQAAARYLLTVSSSSKPNFSARQLEMMA